jgi:hypothetical protein
VKPRAIGSGEALLGGLRAELKARTFQPMPVRERLIPKANGKFRTLGIAKVTSYCFSRKCGPGFLLNVVRVGDAFAAGRVNLRGVANAQAAACSTSRRQVAKLDPVVDRAHANAEPSSNLVYAQLATLEG